MHMRWKGWLACAIAALTAVGCVTALGGTASLSGRLLMEGTGEPVQGEVQLLRSLTDAQPVYQTEAGRKGRFDWGRLKPAAYYLVAVPEDAALCQAGGPMKVDLFNSPVMQVRLPIAPGCAIEGRVNDADGMPLAGVSVTCIPTPEGFAVSPRATTDGKGRFFLKNLPFREGGYTLEGTTLDLAHTATLRVDPNDGVAPLLRGRVTTGVTMWFEHVVQEKEGPK